LRIHLNGGCNTIEGQKKNEKKQVAKTMIKGFNSGQWPRIKMGTDFSRVP